MKRDGQRKGRIFIGRAGLTKWRGSWRGILKVRHLAPPALLAPPATEPWVLDFGNILIDIPKQTKFGATMTTIEIPNTIEKLPKTIILWAIGVRAIIFEQMLCEILIGVFRNMRVSKCPSGQFADYGEHYTLFFYKNDVFFFVPASAFFPFLRKWA